MNVMQCNAMQCNAKNVGKSNASNPEQQGRIRKGCGVADSKENYFGRDLINFNLHFKNL